MTPLQALLTPPLKPPGVDVAAIRVGLIGAGIQRSLSPALHEAEARAQGLTLRYQLVDLDHDVAGATALPALLQAAQEQGLAGVNITYPCKQAVITLLDELSPAAKAMGAVNTVVFRGGMASGHNTDASGWRWGFERSLPGVDLSCVVLLGAGGAGSAIAHSLMGMHVRELRVIDTDAVRAQALVRQLNERATSARAVAVADAATAVKNATGLVHATPTGMDKLPGLPLPASLLHPGLWVSEVVYFPLDTPLLQAARALGLRTSDGGHMAVGQAVGAFELFTGQKADAARMEAHFRQLVKERT